MWIKDFVSPECSNLIWMLHRTSRRQSCIWSIMPHSYSLPSPSTISWKASVVSFANRHGFFGLFFDGILKGWHRKSPSWKSSEWGWAEQRTPVMRGIEPIGNWGLGGIWFSWDRRPNTFLRNHTISYLKIYALFAWWYKLRFPMARAWCIYFDWLI